MIDSARAAAESGSAHPGEDHGEFVAANSRDAACSTSRLLKANPDRLEQRIAGLMTKRIVDLLEAVEVEQKQCGRLAMNDLGQFVQKCVAVGQTGEPIGQRHAPQVLFVIAPVGDVAGDLGKAGQSTGFVTDRIDHDVGPEQAAVAADAPRVGFKPAIGRGDLERAIRRSRRPVLLRVEARIMLTDDLGGGVALDRLRARIPARDDAVRGQPVQRIVLDAADEEFELAIALCPRTQRLVAKTPQPPDFHLLHRQPG